MEMLNCVNLWDKICIMEKKKSAVKVLTVHPKEYECVPETSHYLTASATLILWIQGVHRP